MKKIYTQLIALMIILTAFTATFAQVIIPEEVMRNNNLNNNSTFFEIKRAMNDYWDSKNVKDGIFVENGRETKAAGWKIYKRWEYYWEQRVNQVTGEFPRTNSIIEYQKYLNSNNANDANGNQTDNMENWINLGTNTSAGGYAGLGRINCVAFHPSDLNTFWVGSPSGGIWETTDGGASWNILNDDQQVLGVSDIAIPYDYATSNTLYIATGDRDVGSMWSLNGGQANDNNSVGVLKSTDGGVTWNTTGLSYSPDLGRRIFRLLVHPSNSSILIASTSLGIYKSTDAGATWTLKSISSSRFRDMQFNPADPSIIYAGRLPGNASYVYKSTNTGETWVAKTVPTTIDYVGQIRLAVSPDNSSVVYVACEDGQIYKSTDAGETYFQVNTNTSQNMLGYYTNGSDGASQADYDLTIAASPADANTVFLGSVTTWKSTDGGVTWTANTSWTVSSTYNITGVPEVHADKHILAYQNNTNLFEGNDGGIYKTTNGGTDWTDLTNGIVISQIYRIGISQTDPDIMLTGLQDNGSKKYTGALNTWFDATGGDGMECIIDFNNATSYMYATYVNGIIYRNTNGFTTTARTTISQNIPGGQPDGAWVTPYIMDPTNSAILYAGYDQVWKTTNRGTNWTSASQVLSGTEKLKSLAIAESNTNVIYAADEFDMWKTTDGGATNWTPVTLPFNPNYLTYIAVKNDDPNTLWITYGGYTDGEKVYRSSDGGATWTNISAGLPNLPVMSIVYKKNISTAEVLFVGTDVGVYLKDGTMDWASYNTGLPNVVVTELEIFYGGTVDKLVAGTYGRGLWETDIDAALPVELSSFVSSVDQNNVTLNWTTASERNNSGFEIERSVTNGEWIKTGSIAGHGNTNEIQKYSFTDKDLNTGKYNYRLKQIDYNGNFEYFNLSNEVNIGVPERFELSQNFPNPFNPSTKINYTLPTDGKVSLKIYDSKGMEIMTLVNEVKTAGYYSVDFYATGLSSGVYFYSISSDKYSATKKMLLIK